jgi:hypothetical protein
MAKTIHADFTRSLPIRLQVLQQRNDAQSAIWPRLYSARPSIKLQNFAADKNIAPEHKYEFDVPSENTF